MGKKIEILAPCGNAESFTAAVNAGANAVYIGLKQFSARGNADNFSFEELAEAVRQCRLCGVKLYLAMNTLVFDDEFRLLHEYIRKVGNCDELTVDAIIVQDLGVVAAIREINPHIPIHASTQMSVTSVSGVKVLGELGFSRVVLARELSREEIARICRECEVEVEVFVHGAHCVSVSGQCYMSGILGTGDSSKRRSGNRGICAQPCRLEFSSDDSEHALSLKDLSLIQHIGELREMGVASIKIEGRMKRPEYVFAAVDACKKALNGDIPDMALLCDLFSRNGFTDGYYIGDYSGMGGVRTKKDVLITAEALGMENIQKRLKTPYKRYSVDFHLQIKRDLPTQCSALTVAANTEVKVAVTGEVPENSVRRSITSDLAKSQLAKLGGTVFEAGNIECEIETGLTLKTSQLNQLRREVVENLSEKIIDMNKAGQKWNREQKGQG
ncbi:MAG: U32 family peptidase [Oscillospiraceae bacterium]|nr:U32 family peptidase [Oscillospiraceae bacterium]